jgi:hypothetical protein
MDMNLLGAVCRATGHKIENCVTHEIFMILWRHGMWLFKIHASLLVQALQGGVTKLNTFWTQKVTN